MRSEKKKQDEFCSMWKRNSEMVYAMCVRQAKPDMQKCDDLVQEVVISLWNDYNNTQFDKSIGWERSWVWWHARRVLSHQRRKKVIEPLPEGIDVIDKNAMMEKEIQETLEDIISFLSDKERKVVKMRMGGYEYKEIAKEIDVPTAAAAKQIMYRAKKEMRQRVTLTAILTIVAIAVPILIFVLLPIPRYDSYCSTEKNKDISVLINDIETVYKKYSE